MSKTHQNAADVYIVMPLLWQPHSDACAHNESSMLDWEGNMRDQKDWEQGVLDDIPEDTGLASGLRIPMEECSLNKDHPHDEEEQAKNAYWHIPWDCNQVSSVLMSVSRVLDQSVMCALLEQQAEVLDFQQFLGSLMVGEGDCLMSNDGEVDNSSMGDKSGSDTTTSNQEDDLNQESDDDDIDQIMVFGISTGRFDGVDPKHLTKIWRISFDDAKRTIGVTTLHVQQTQEPTLSQNYGTYDWMLHYCCIHEDFFMDTFFVTS